MSNSYYMAPVPISLINSHTHPFWGLVGIGVIPRKENPVGLNSHYMAPTYKSHEWRLHALGHRQRLRAQGLRQHLLRPVQDGPGVGLEGRHPAEGAGEREGALRGQVVGVVHGALGTRVVVVVGRRRRGEVQ